MRSSRFCLSVFPVFGLFLLFSLFSDAMFLNRERIATAEAFSVRGVESGVQSGELAAEKGESNGESGKSNGESGELAAEKAETFILTRILPDWEKQEKALGRTLESREALRSLARRAEALLVKMESEKLVLSGNADALRKRICAAEAFGGEEGAECRRLYVELRTELRNVIFENPLIRDIPIVFLQEDRYIWQLIHEYNSFFYRFTNAQGGDFYQLDHPGRSFEAKPLIETRLPRGVFATPILSYDMKTLYFAYADFSRVVPEGAKSISATELRARKNAVSPEELARYESESEGKFHLFRMDLATREIRQLTDGPFDDVDPCLLPNGDLIFISTRRGGYARCTDDWEPVQTATLHKLHVKTGEVERLSWHETNEWNPSVLKDGRILYSRWDYVDREAARYMNLWITNPDGTNAQALFGNYTEQIVASLQAKEIPESKKILFLGSGHHLAVGGTLAILDPTKTLYDPETSEDTMDCIERISPEIAFPETPTDEPGKFHVSDRYYYGPYPLSEDFYLASFSHDSNGGYLATKGSGYGIRNQGYEGSVLRENGAGKLGLYYRDRFGNLELIYEHEKISCRYPIQLKSRPVPATVPSRLPERSEVCGAPSLELGASGKGTAEGTFVLFNVYESLAPFPKDRPIRELRVFELLPKYPSPRRDKPKCGYAHAENPRAFLGSVPVESDGSAYFKAPACRPLYFQAVDGEGRAVQTMLSEVYLQPGERRGCIGCHEQIQTTQENVSRQTLALNRPASELKPGPKGSAPFSFSLLIQPILESKCVSCHAEEGAKPDLRGIPTERFTLAYDNLENYVKFYDWSSRTIRFISSRPGLTGSTVSPLVEILKDENHREKARLTEDERRAVYLWLDANAPFFGTGCEKEQERQRRGEETPILRP